MEFLKIILVLVLIVVDQSVTARSTIADCENTEVAKCMDNRQNRAIPIVDDLVTVCFLNESTKCNRLVMYTV